MGSVQGDGVRSCNATHLHYYTDATAIDHHIYFREGAYRPGTADGNALIAREVAHIQRAKLTGSSNAKPSAEASGAEKQDAENVAGIVQTMGSNPAQILQPVSKKPTPAQQRVIQRADGDDFSGSRTAGIVFSKVVQGIFTTVLGPVGLVWRGPLVQKNLGEIWGKNIASRPGKVDDRKRYGETHLGTAMRWLASISELLKEFTIWLGFGTFIAAIVAAATHGVAAPVFAGLAIATAVTAGLHFVLRALLVTLNGDRLYKKQKQAGGADEKAAKAEAAIPFIKHQMVSKGARIEIPVKNPTLAAPRLLSRQHDLLCVASPAGRAVKHWLSREDGKLAARAARRRGHHGRAAGGR